MWLQVWLIMLIAALTQASAPSRLSPAFTLEPPPHVRYAARSGTAVHCVARAPPPAVTQVTWVTEDDLPLADTNTLGRVLSNGTLEVFASSTRRDAATLRCRAANSYGVLLSRDVVLQPVFDESWEVELSVFSAGVGGVAALRCSGEPALWYRGERVLQTDAPAPASRYLQAGDTLLIRGVTSADASDYSCASRHTLSAHTRRSQARTLHVPTIGTGSAPRSLGSVDAWARRGAGACLPCAAGDYPLPTYTWYREISGRLQLVSPDSTLWLWSEGAALCITRVASDHAGAWLCRAGNQLGDVTTHVTLSIDDALTVSVEPSVVVVDAGSTVRLNCSVSETTAGVSWLHDGTTVATPSGNTRELILRDVSRRAAGVYQCVARRVHGRRPDCAQASAEIRMGESAPELQYTFIEQALRAGGAGALRCAAAAAPPPTFSWTVDDAPLEQYLPPHSYSVHTWSAGGGSVVSVLNITSLTASHGGRYACHARNARGHVLHSARLNVYGPAMIRSGGAARAVAGDNATVHCPYAGYPISTVTWMYRGGREAVPAEGRVRARGAALFLTPAAPADAGHYTCVVTQADTELTLRRDVLLQVRNPPKISPFMFSPELTEGSSVQVLCGVSSGDKPMYFSWLKDGAPIPPDLQIEEKSLNEFSLLMFSHLTSRHSGEYTCRVSNHAAVARYSATLTVQVAPTWATEPLDSAVVLGAPLRLPCAARGHPPPKVTWSRSIGIRSSYETNEWEEITSWGSNEAGQSLYSQVSEESGGVRGTLAARGAGRALQGRYRCVADNGVGAPLVKHINLTVHEPVTFVEESTTRNASSVRAADATLTCAVRGDAPLAVVWARGDQAVDNMNSFRWSVTESTSGGALVSSLRVRGVTSRDAGLYRCTASNPHARSEHVMYLTVQEPPSAVNGLRLAGVDSRWVRLTWSHVGGEGGEREGGTQFGARVSALHALAGAAPQRDLNLTVVHGNNESLGVNVVQLYAKIEDLRPASAYSVRVRAHNIVGASPYSDPLVFTTLDEAPSEPPQNIQIRVIGIDELHVTWSAPPQDSWNGALLGYVISWRRVSGAPGEGRGEAGLGVRGRAVVGGWSSTTLTLEGMTQFARYCLSVRAYSRAGMSPHSVDVCHTLILEGVPESPPSNVWCEGISASELRMRWSAPPAPSAGISGYDVNYNEMFYSNAWSGTIRSAWRRAEGSSLSAVLRGLRAGNYSVSVRARSPHGPGPPAETQHCATMDDVGGAISSWSAAGGAGWLRVTWGPVPRATHYTVHTQLADKSGEEWTQRIEANSSDSDEMRTELRGLSTRARYSLRMRSETRAGPGPITAPIVVAPVPPSSARITSIARTFNIPLGSRVRLPCAAIGPLPLRRRWTPIHAPHTITDEGDLIIHKAEVTASSNYTCSVRGSSGPADSITHSLRVLPPRPPPAPRLLRAGEHAVLLGWDQKRDAVYDEVMPVIGYTLWYAPTWQRDVPPRPLHVPGDATTARVSRLACGAPYTMWLSVHTPRDSDSPRDSFPLKKVPGDVLRVRTRGDKAKSPPVVEAVYANSTSLRVNLLSWRAGRCDVTSWAVALRSERDALWTPVQADSSGDYAVIVGLSPGAWHWLRVTAHSPAGDTSGLYRVPTLTDNGERLGEPVQLSDESGSVTSEDIGGASEGRGTVAGGWGAAALCAGAGVAALAALLLTRVLRASSRAPPAPPAPRQPPHQLYSTEPSKRNGKMLTPPDGSLEEISPYATFTMSGLQLRTFGRAEPPPLACAAPAPHEYGPGCGAGGAARTRGAGGGGGGDSDSESSGSPCAACALELYRLPAAHLSDTLPAIESSTEDTSYSGGGSSGRGARGVRGARGGRRRRDRPKHPPPNARYKSSLHHSSRCE